MAYRDIIKELKSLKPATKNQLDQIEKAAMLDGLVSPTLKYPESMTARQQKKLKEIRYKRKHTRYV